MGPNITLLVFMIVFGVVSTPVIFFASVYQLAITNCITSSIFLFLASLISLAGLHLNILLFRQQLDEWYDPKALQHLKVFALLIMAIGVVFFGFYLTKAVRKHEDTFSLSSNYVTAASCLLSTVMSCWFFYLCSWSKRFVRLCHPLLTPKRPWRPYPNL